MVHTLPFRPCCIIINSQRTHTHSKKKLNCIGPSSKINTGDRVPFLQAIPRWKEDFTGRKVRLPYLPSYMYYWVLYHINADIDCTLEKTIKMNGIFFLSVYCSGALGLVRPKFSKCDFLCDSTLNFFSTLSICLANIFTSKRFLQATW